MVIGLTVFVFHLVYLACAHTIKLLPTRPVDMIKCARFICFTLHGIFIHATHPIRRTPTLNIQFICPNVSNNRCCECEQARGIVLQSNNTCELHKNRYAHLDVGLYETTTKKVYTRDGKCFDIIKDSPSCMCVYCVGVALPTRTSIARVCV